MVAKTNFNVMTYYVRTLPALFMLQLSCVPNEYLLLEWETLSYNFELACYGLVLLTVEAPVLQLHLWEKIFGCVRCLGIECKEAVITWVNSF
jgi:hypothetical protein